VLVSLLSGIVFGIIIYGVALVYVKWVYIYYVSIVVSALLFVVLGLIIKRTFIIFMTSMYGSFIIAYGVGIFAGGFPVFIDTAAKIHTRPHNYWLMYVYVAGIILGTILGMILQYKIFARGLTWDNVKSKVCPKKSRYADELGTPLMETGSKKKKKSRTRRGKY
jgi:hypothetical protein